MDEMKNMLLALTMTISKNILHLRKDTCAVSPAPLESVECKAT